MPNEGTTPSESKVAPPIGGPGGGAELPGAAGSLPGGVMAPGPGPVKPADLPENWIPAPELVPTAAVEMFTLAWRKNPRAVVELLRSIVEH